MSMQRNREKLCDGMNSGNRNVACSEAILESSLDNVIVQPGLS